MPRHFGLLAIAAAAVPLFMACGSSNGGGLLGQQPGTTAATKIASVASTAATTGTAVSNPGGGSGTAGIALPPDQMLQALDSTITDAESPRGFLNGSNGQIAHRDQPDADMAKFNAAGQIFYGTKMGSSEDNPLTYVVFPTESEATSYEQKASVKFFTRNVQDAAFAPTGIAEPARCITAALVNAAGMTYGGGSACLARAGIVVVIGESQVGGTASRGNNNNAIAVTMLGLNHIPIAVAAFTPRATATSVATVLPVADATQRPPAATQPPRPSASSAATVAATRPPAIQPPPVTNATTIVQSSGATRPPGNATRPPPGGATLYAALLATPFDARELPAGFSSPRVVIGSPDDNDRKHLVVGEVDVQLRGPDTLDVINYTVFQNDAEAKAAYEGELSFAQGDAVLGSFVPSGAGANERCIFGRAATGQQYGFTSCVILAGNTYITAYSRIGGNLQRGDDAAAAALAIAALAHLNAVRAT